MKCSNCQSPQVHSNCHHMFCSACHTRECQARCDKLTIGRWLKYEARLRRHRRVRPSY